MTKNNVLGANKLNKLKRGQFFFYRIDIVGHKEQNCKNGLKLSNANN